MLQDPQCLNLAPGGSGGGRVGIVPIRLQDGSFTTVDREEFWTNRSAYMATNEGMAPAIEVSSGKRVLISTADLDGYKFVHPAKDRVAVRIADEFKSVSREQFVREGLRGVNAGMVSGENNPLALYVIIRDAEGKSRYLCRGNFKETCKKNGLPFVVLRRSYNEGGAPIYQHKRSAKDAERQGFSAFIGWSAMIVATMKEQLAREAALDELIKIDQELELYV